jgi:hypothetical protein
MPPLIAATVTEMTAKNPLASIFKDNKNKVKEPKEEGETPTGKLCECLSFIGDNLHKDSAN